jgi:hypothetical protein
MNPLTRLAEAAFGYFYDRAYAASIEEAEG